MSLFEAHDFYVTTDEINKETWFCYELLFSIVSSLDTTRPSFVQDIATLTIGTSLVKRVYALLLLFTTYVLST